MRARELSPATVLLREIVSANPEARSAAAEVGEPTDPADSTRPVGEFRTDRTRAVGEAVNFLTGFPIRKAMAIHRAVGELRTLQDQGRTPHYGILKLHDRVDGSIRKHNKKVRSGGTGSIVQTLRTVDDYWDRNLGSTILPANIDLAPQALGPELEPLGRFYTEDRMFAPREGRKELRGERYFVTAQLDIPADRQLEVMRSDVTSALSVIGSVDRGNINSGGNFLAYLGVMDYLKIHSLTLFHALTYDERYLQFVKPGDRRRYQELRDMSADMARESVRRYYQTFLGLPSDGELDAKKFWSEFKKVSKYVGGQSEASIWGNRGSAGDSRLKYPEVNHPLVIALGAQEAVIANPNTDVVVGIPSGGTELAYCAELLYELRDRNVDVVQIPVSHRFYRNQGDLNAMVERDYRYILDGRSALVVDDNASTGTTVSYVGRAIARLASEVAVHTAEFDGRRLDKERGTEFFSSSASPSTMSIAEIQTSGDGRFVPQYVISLFERIRRQNTSRVRTSA